MLDAQTARVWLLSTTKVKRILPVVTKAFIGNTAGWIPSSSTKDGRSGDVETETVCGCLFRQMAFTGRTARPIPLSHLVATQPNPWCGIRKYRNTSSLGDSEQVDAKLLAPRVPTRFISTSRNACLNVMRLMRKAHRFTVCRSISTRVSISV